MNINTNNYEEYFLLYADNELSARDKNMVEDFVSQHPELEEELLMFKQSVIKPDDDCVLEDKGSLFKETKKFISHDNYQEILIMYNDNELNDWEREQIETFLLQNAHLTAEVMLLQRTKLVPDTTITFPGKRLLYKKEGKGKVVPIKWWRNVAAAIVAAIGLWLGMTYIQNGKDKLPVAVENNPLKKNDEIAPIAVMKNSDESIKNTIEESSRNKNISSEKNVSSEKLVLKNSTGNSPDLHLLKKQRQRIIDPKQSINIKDIEGNQGIAVKEITELNDIKLLKKYNDSGNVLIREPKHDDVAINDKNVLPANYALPTSYTFDEDENSNNYVFYNITKEEFNRTKLGGFLRKVKRTIERKSPFNNLKDDKEVVEKDSKNL